MAKIIPKLMWAEKEGIERVSDISKNPINTKQSKLRKGKDQGDCWGNERENGDPAALSSSNQVQAQNK